PATSPATSPDQAAQRHPEILSSKTAPAPHPEQFSIPPAISASLPTAPANPPQSIEDRLPTSALPPNLPTRLQTFLPASYPNRRVPQGNPESIAHHAQSSPEIPANPAQTILLSFGTGFDVPSPRKQIPPPHIPCLPPLRTTNCS